MSFFFKFYLCEYLDCNVQATYNNENEKLDSTFYEDEPRGNIDYYLRRLMLELSEKSALSKPQKSKKCKDATAQQKQQTSV